MNKNYGFNESSEIIEEEEKEKVKKRINYLNIKKKEKQKEKESLDLYEKYYININNKIRSDYNLLSLEEKQIKNEESLAKSKKNKVKKEDDTICEGYFNEFKNFLEKPAHIIVKNMKEVYNQRTISILNINTNNNSFRKYDKKIIKIIYKDQITYAFNEFSFLILDEYYCFIDLLNEATIFYHLLKPSDYIFKDLKGNVIDLTYTVNSYYPTLLEQNESDPTIFLVPIPVKKSYKFDEKEYHNKDLVPSNSIDQISKIINEDLKNIENNLIQGIFLIIIYIFFIVLVFYVTINNTNLKEIYGVNKAINNIIKSSFYSNNYKGLDNNFDNIYNIDDIYNFIYKYFLSSFDYKNNITYLSINATNKYDNNYNQTTKVLQNYYVIGQFRFTKIVSDPNINKSAVVGSVSPVASIKS